MKRMMQDELGMALAAAVLVLLVVGALLAGTFFAGTHEQRTAENVRRLQQSFGIAEAGNFEVLRAWDQTALGPLRRYPADSSRVALTASPSGTGSYAGYIYKLTNRLYFLDITGSDKFTRGGQIWRGGARQRIGVLVAHQPFTVDLAIKAAITARDNVHLEGTSFVDGRDHIPGPWAAADCDSGAANGGVRSSDTLTLAQAAFRSDGSPPILIDSTVTPSTFTTLGNVTYADLVARANVTLSGGTYTPAPVVTGGGTCDRTVLTNWGDGRNPAGACSAYFPIIHITGLGATVVGGQGQGILLVDGDLNVQSGFEFFGITVVQGHLNTLAGGPGNLAATFWGGVLTNEVELRPGDIKINFSRCAITQALSITGSTSVARSRSWKQLY